MQATWEVPDRALPLSAERCTFPMVACAGPGLAVRVLGDVTQGDALDVLRQVSNFHISLQLPATHLLCSACPCSWHGSAAWLSA